MFGGNPFYRSTPYGSGYYPYGHQTQPNPIQYPDPFHGLSNHATERARHERHLEQQRIEREKLERARQYLPDEYDVPPPVPNDYDVYDDVDPWERSRPRTRTQIPIRSSSPLRMSMPEPQLNQYGQNTSHQPPIPPQLYPDDAYTPIYRSYRKSPSRSSSQSRSHSRRPSPSPAPVPPVPSQSLPSPAPTPPPKLDTHEHHVEQSLASIASIETQFQQLQKDFVWPSHLDFQCDQTYTLPIDNSSPPPAEGTPKLAFTTNNKPVHAYNEMLNRLLVNLDSVESWGERSVRERRRAVVLAVEAEASRLEQRWKSVWYGSDATEPVVDAAQVQDS